MACFPQSTVFSMAQLAQLIGWDRQFEFCLDHRGGETAQAMLISSIGP